MTKPVEVVVNDKTFVIRPLAPFEQLKAFGDLQKELLPALSSFMSMKGGEDLIDPAMVKDAMTILSTQLSGDRLEYWCNRLLTKDTIVVDLGGGDDRKLDGATRALAFGDFTDILELLYRVIVVNFAEPLRDFANRFGLGELLSKAQNQSGSTAAT